jgi:hypothetical protein
VIRHQACIEWRREKVREICSELKHRQEFNFFYLKIALQGSCLVLYMVNLIGWCNAVRSDRLDAQKKLLVGALMMIRRSKTRHVEMKQRLDKQRQHKRSCLKQWMDKDRVINTCQCGVLCNAPISL